MLTYDFGMNSCNFNGMNVNGGMSLKAGMWTYFMPPEYLKGMFSQVWMIEKTTARRGSFLWAWLAMNVSLSFILKEATVFGL
jgi:hypothetical protein